MYIQYACDFAELKESQQRIGLYVACTSVIIGWLWCLMIFYSKEKAEMEFKMWDMNTATAADFTVQLTITPGIYHKWLDWKAAKHIADKTFKDYIKRQVIEQVKAKPYRFEKIDMDAEVDIGCISFAYDNKKMLELLAERGKYVTQQNSKKIKEIEDIIQIKLETHFEEYTRPVTAFVTFTTQEAFERCVYEFKTSKNAFRVPKFKSN